MNKKILIASLFATLMLLVPMTSVVGVISKNVTMDNHPPGKPKIRGPTGVPPGTYEYTFNATDPDGDNVSYIIDWGDTNAEETAFYASGEEVTVVHTYLIMGAYIVCSRAKDIHGAVGPEGYTPVIILRNRHMINAIFFQFIERFPNLFPILQKILSFIL